MSFGRNPYYQGPVPRQGRVRLTFSRIELLHLAAGIAALTLAFSFLLDDDTGPARFVPNGPDLLAALVAVATGFVLHELAHKLVAQHYGHWAEFRAQFMGLALTVLLAAAVRFLFAAPGAVMIQGRVTPRENGLISLVGPGTNLVIGLVAWIPLAPPGLDVNTGFPRILHLVAFVNALLAGFNLIPLGNLDGRKVLRWNKLVYAVVVVAAIALFVAVVLTTDFPGTENT